MGDVAAISLFGAAVVSSTFTDLDLFLVISVFLLA